MWNALSVLHAEGLMQLSITLVHERDKSFGIGIMQSMETLRIDGKSESNCDGFDKA